MDNAVQAHDSQLVIIKEQKLGQRPDLGDVVTLVLPHIQVRHWKRIGLALGMKKSTLDGLGKYSNDYSCYLKTLSYWLEHGSSVTWKTLLDVLGHLQTKHFVDGLTYTIVSELSVFPSILKSQTVESGVQTDEKQVDWPAKEQDGLWRPNAATVGGDVRAETEEHEYKPLMDCVDGVNQPLISVSGIVKRATIDTCRRGINAMLNYPTGGSIHFGIHDDSIVAVGLDLEQNHVIDS